jgi:hypothetical protein
MYSVSIIYDSCKTTILEYTCTMVHVYHNTIDWYQVHVYVQHYLKNDLKYKHSGATGTLVGVVSIEDITVHYG